MGSFCAGCGNSLAAGDRFCRVCGRDNAVSTAVAGATLAPPPPAAYPDTSGKAIVSLVCGLFFFFFPVSVVAVVFGHLALSEIRKSAGRLKGDGLAIAGLIMGYAGLAVIPVLIIAAIAIPNLLRARMAANESSAVAGVRQLVVAETAYTNNHSDEGFACSLAKLADEQLIPTDLATGSRNGYSFEIPRCSPGTTGAPNLKFQVVAHPLTPNTSGIRAFCADESGTVKVDSGGSAENCVESGTPLQ